MGGQSKNLSPVGTIVTGGASGIGREICLRMAALGVVGVLDQNREGIFETIRLIESQGNRAVALEADVTDAVSIEKGFSTFEHSGTPIDIVVACAGVERLGTVIDEPEENWDLVMGVNAKGVYLTARSAFRRFVSRRGGRFIAIASDAGLTGTSGFGVYTASKFAVVGLVRTLALDFGHLGVCSNAVCPGNVQTPMMDQYLKERPYERDLWQREMPAGRFAQVREVAAVVEYLASPQASYINGNTFVVDGGGLAGPYLADT